MTTRPRVWLVGHGEQVAQVRRWLLEAGAQPVVDGLDVAGVVVVASSPPHVPQGVPVLDAAAADRGEVADFVRRVAGRATHLGDDHGSPASWPRGSF